MMYTYNKQDAGVRKFDTSSVYAIDCGGRIYTLAYAGPKDEYKFKPIAGACKDPAPYAGKYKTQEAAIDAALKDDYTVYEFGNEDEFYAWLGKRYAAPVLPFNGVVPRPTDTERIELLEKRVTQMRDWWGKKMDEFAETLRETLMNKTKPEEDVPTRWEPSHRENGFYVVTTPAIPIPFVAHSVNGKWYIPGEKLHYAGYLRVHRKVGMNG